MIVRKKKEIGSIKYFFRLFEMTLIWVLLLLFSTITVVIAQHNFGAARRNAAGNAAGGVVELSKKASESFNSKTTSEKALHFARQQRLLAEIDRNRKRDQVKEKTETSCISYI